GWNARQSARHYSIAGYTGQNMQAKRNLLDRSHTSSKSLHNLRLSYQCRCTETHDKVDYRGGFHMEGNGRRLAWVAIALSVVALIVSVGGRAQSRWQVYNESPGFYAAPSGPQGQFGPKGPQDQFGPQGPQGQFGQPGAQREFGRHDKFGPYDKFGPEDQF